MKTSLKCQGIRILLLVCLTLSLLLCFVLAVVQVNSPSSSQILGSSREAHLHQFKSGKMQQRSQLNTQSIYSQFQKVNAKTHYVTTDLWEVLSKEGVTVRSSQLQNSSNVITLPQGTLIIMKTIHHNMLSKSQSHIQTIQLIFPVDGWIDAEAISDSSKPPSTVRARSQTRLTSVQIARLRRLTITRVAKPVINPEAVCRSDKARYMNRTDILNSDLSAIPVPTTSIYGCCILCATHEACTSFTRTGDGSCWLKQNRPGTQLRAIPPTVTVDITSGMLDMETSASKRLMIASPFTPLKRIRPCCSKDSYDPIEMDRETDGENDSTSDGDGASPYLLRLQRVRNDWTQQWPVGTGRFGALVGGLLGAEVVPLSIAGLYSHRKPTLDPASVSQPLQQDAQEQLPPKPSRFEAFQNARSLLKSGNIAQAQSAAQGMITSDKDSDFDGPLGMFEYLADLVLITSSLPIILRKSVIAASGKVNDINKVELDPNGDTSTGGRTELIQRVTEGFGLQSRDASNYSKLAQADANTKESAQSNPFQSVPSPAILETILDLKRATAHSFAFIDGETSNSHDDKLDNIQKVYKGLGKVHHREWFGSWVDQVLVGHFTCSNVKLSVNGTNANTNNSAFEDVLSESEKEDIGGCLNLFISLSREKSYVDATPIVAVKIQQYHDGVAKTTITPSRDIPAKLLLEGELQSHSVAYTVDMSLQSSVELIVPQTHFCGVIVCRFTDEEGFSSLSHRHAGEAESVGGVNSGSLGPAEGVVCNGAKSVDMVLSAQSATPVWSGGLDGKGSYDSEKVASACWLTLTVALESARNKSGEGSSDVVSRLRKRHQEAAQIDMERVQLQLHTSNATRVCDAGPLADRLCSVGAGCDEGGGISNADAGGGEIGGESVGSVKAKKSPRDALDVHLFAQAFQYGRYLHFASAGGALSNLQGVWADGPKAAWNGDYHMNINLQMQYWLADLSGCSRTIQSLLTFVEQLAVVGREAARDVYGVRSKDAWVAHGFTDDRLSGGVLGDCQWALCVTCGAWVAVQAWEHALHISGTESIAIVTRLLPVLRGAVRFFLEYMWVDETGTVHTGPTTSPENSYEVVSRKALQVQSLLPVGSLGARQSRRLLEKSQQILQKLAVAVGGVGAQLSSPTAVAQAQANMLFLQRQQRHKILPLNHPHPVPPTPGVFPQLAFSPAIDVSILRLLSNAFSLSLSWSEQVDTEIHQTDLQLAKEFQSMVIRMNHGGRPSVDPKTDSVSEYPSPVKVGSDQECTQTSAEFDAGHRHWSALHFLYPSPLPPGRGFNSSLAVIAAERSMRLKEKGKGGHTSWSAAWEACLWARLGRGEESEAALTRLLSRYTAANMLSLHPALMGRPDVEGCSTCFSEGYESQSRVSGVQAEGNSNVRGLTTNAGDKFQLDGNLGFVAAIGEMLVQSQTPGTLLLLPALSKALGGAGYATGLRARGDIEVSMVWSGGLIRAANITLHSRHRWIVKGGVIETEQGSGFFESLHETNVSTREADLEVLVVTPNALQMLDNQSHSSCASVSSDVHPYTLSRVSAHSTNEKSLLVVTASGNSFPCHIILCSHGVSDDNCLQMLLRTST